MADQPCRVCNHPRPRDGGGQASVMTSRQALAASSVTCVICHLFARGITAVLASHGDQDAAVGTMKEPDCEWLRIDFNRANARPSLDIHIFSSGIALSLFSPSNLPLGRRHIPASTASPESCAWARSKLLRCEALHSSCRDVRGDFPAATAAAVDGSVSQGHRRRRPRRLIDIGSKASAAATAVHLVEDDDMHAADYIYYAALSHCWGRDRRFLQTVKANVAAHRAGIVLDSLPRTFREAVDATRRLGLRYLWIDSLCIIQDDALDWQTESSRMADVYQGAYIVLSAGAAAGAHEGLYSDRAASCSYKPHIEDVVLADGIHAANEERHDGMAFAGQVAFRRAFAHMPSPMQRQLQTVPEFPTLTRGWIYQERLLASRVLHFGPHELHWECMVDSICQCRDPVEDADDEEEEEAALSPTASTKPEFSRQHWQSLDAHQRSVSWHRMVENYTALHLSFDKDIFPALSGIAQSFQSVTGSTYLAGLWESSLVADLLWYAHPPSGANVQAWQRRPKTWRSPSWSWAAVQGPVKYINTHNGIAPFCSVVDAQVHLVGSDETGEVQGGHIVLRGYAMSTQVSFRRPPDDGPEKYQPWNLLQLGILQKQIANVWADYNCHLQDDLPTSVTCFLLGECIPSGALVMLILKSTMDADGRRVHERIGIVQVSIPPSRHGSQEYWLQIFPCEQLEVKVK